MQRALSSFSLLCLLWLAACGSAPVVHPTAMPLLEPDFADTDDEDLDNSFEMASATSNDDLSNMRGGFLMAGGLRIDFGLTTSTAINGIVVSNLTLSSNSLNGHLPQNLQQLIQVGTGNNFDSPSSTPTTSKVLTLVQNSTNGATIVNTNTLNLSVSHFNSSRIESAIQGSLFSQVRALR